MRSTASCARLAILALGALACGEESDDDRGEMIASSQGAALVVYDDPYAPAMAGTPNPITPGARASALAFDMGGELRIELAVTGFPPARIFGSHLHQRDCNDEKAGGHYQNTPFPMGRMANDPEFANPVNEAWLDFETDAAGEGAVELRVAWLPRAGEGKGIVFHHMATAEGGGAGARLACLPVTGF
jgi:Cu-Zn family superoxide dismutase